jgi:hypothetical protein
MLKQFHNSQIGATHSMSFLKRNQMFPGAASFLLMLLTFSGRLLAEDHSASTESCLNTNVVSVPSRPTISNGADTTQCGVVEMEYGLERQWPGGGIHRDDLTGGLRFGINRKLDFHWASADFLRIADGSGTRTGFADTWLGAKYHFLDQSGNRPGLGFFYQVKIPAGERLGLSTGKVDQSFAFLVSKDIHPIRFDFNVIPLLAGRVNGSGWDHNVGFALSGAMPLTRGLSVVGEGYGVTALNAETPAFGSSLLAFTYQLTPRLTLDTGLEVGVTHDAPKKRVFVGVTYAIANLYSWMRSNK